MLSCLLLLIHHSLKLRSHDSGVVLGGRGYIGLKKVNILINRSVQPVLKCNKEGTGRRPCWDRGLLLVGEAALLHLHAEVPVAQVSPLA